MADPGADQVRVANLAPDSEGDARTAAEAPAAAERSAEPARLRRTGQRLPEQAFRTGGGLLTQAGHVRTSCFPASLRGVLSDISQHFGRPVVVTSGFRPGRGGSYHKRCMAADIQIAGVAPGAIARFARKHGSVGGVGTYRHTRSVHVDVGERVFSWHGGRRRSASLGAGCCPDCAAEQARRTGRRFEAVCTG